MLESKAEHVQVSHKLKGRHPFLGVAEMECLSELCLMSTPAAVVLILPKLTVSFDDCIPGVSRPRDEGTRLACLDLCSAQ